MPSKKAELSKTVGSERPASERKSRARPLARLAPLEHIKNLYAGANATVPSHGKQRRIFHKRDLIEAVRYVSPVKAALNQSGKAPKQRGVTTDGVYQEGIDSTTKALIDLEDNVNNYARRFNDLRETADRKQAELNKLKDQLRELEMEADTLDRIAAKSTPDALRIEELQHEIESVNERKNDKMMQKRQYEHMAKRLKTNQINFDSHIKGMENALKASRKEYSEVHKLMTQLEHSKLEAQQGLRSFEVKIDAQRKLRTKELDERRSEASNARRMEEWRKLRETQRAEMAAELRGDLTAEQEQELLRQLQEREGESEQLKAASLARERKAMTLEEAFVQIRQATGVTTLDEMVEKFMGQGDNKKALEDEKEEAEQRLAKVKQQQEEAERQFAEMKASGVGGTELSRELQDRKEREIQLARAQLKVNQSACERLESVLVAVRQGAVGLSQRLNAFEFLDPGDHKDEDEDEDDMMMKAQTGDPKTEDTLRMLRKSERILVKMLEAMAGPTAGAPERAPAGRAAEEESRRLRSSHSARPEPAEEKRPWTPFDNNDPIIHTNNIRVESLRTKLTELSMMNTPRQPSGAASVDSDEDEEDDVKDRSTLKRRSEKAAADAQRRIDALAKKNVNTVRNARARQRDHIASLANTHEFTPSVTFLTEKPELL